MPLIPAWKLQGHPFPHTGRSLAPKSDPAQLGYYLDFYDWSEAKPLNGLGPNGSINVSGLRGPDTTTILISGSSGSGRSSAKNLLLYHLEQASIAGAPGNAPRPAPLIVDVPVPLSTDQKQVAVTLSMLLVGAATARNPAAGALLQATLAMWNGMSGPGADVAPLFALLQAQVVAQFPDTDVIFALDASSHTMTRDTARKTNGMLQGFATFVIMSLTKADDARFIRDELSGRRPAIWIGAGKVESAKMKGYVAAQVAAQRAAGFAGDPLLPFTDGAIDYLFETAAGPGHVPLSIRLVLEKLSTAMARKEQAPGAPPSPITRADMQAVLA